MDSLALLGQSCKELSSIRRNKIKPTLARDCTHLCDMEYDDTELLFGQDIAKSIAKAKELGKVTNSLSQSGKKYSSPYKYERKDKGGRNQRNKQHHFLEKGRRNQNGPLRRNRKWKQY